MMTMELDDLKSCPFCGEALNRVDSLAQSFDPPRMYHEYHHPRNDCVALRSLPILWAGEAGSEHEAAWIAKWNRRVALPTAAATAVTEEGLMIRFMAELHANVPEADQPASRSDFSDEQWARVKAAYEVIRSAVAPSWKRPCILCANGNDLPDGETCEGCGRVGSFEAALSSTGEADEPVAWIDPRHLDHVKTAGKGVVVLRRNFNPDNVEYPSCNFPLYAHPASSGQSREEIVEERGWQDIATAPTNQPVLLAIPTGVYRGYRASLKMRWTIDGKTWNREEPTRWQPLPTPPLSAKS